MPASLNVQPAKRGDARGLAAHAYRFGSVEDHVDHDRTYLNKVLFGPSTFQEAKAEIDALPSKQPNGRKIRSDANYTAQLVCTFPEELDEDKLNAWAASTVQWASKDAPGQLLYAVMHRDEGRPHIHLGIAALEEESGKLNYKALFGRDNKDDPGYRLMAMQGSYATAIKSMGVAPTEGKEYEDTGMNAWRILKAREEGRQEKAAELQRDTEKLNAEKSENQALSQRLETARQTALTAERERKAQDERDEAAKELEEEEREKKREEEERDREKTPAGPSREEIIKERDAEWNKSYKSKFKEANQKLDRITLPETKVFETTGGYRERILDRFTTWRANVLNYVAKLKTLLERAELEVTKQAQRAQGIVEQDRSYRELVSLMTPEEKARIDTRLDVLKAEKQQAREQEREQRNQAQDQGWSK